MSANKLNILKTLVILGCLFWILPAKADEIAPIVSSTPEIVTSTTDTVTTTTPPDTNLTSSTDANLTPTSTVETNTTTTSTIDVATTTISNTTTETNTSSTEQIQTNGSGGNTQTQIFINNIVTSTTDTVTTTTPPDTNLTSSTDANLTPTSTVETNTTTTSTIDVATTTISNTTTETNTSSTEQIQTNGSGGNTQTQIFINNNEINNSIQKILNFLKSNQLENGSIIDLQTSDWSAMSFGANNTYANEIKNTTLSLYDYLNNTLITQDTGTLNNCAEYPRHILGLLAGGTAKTNTQVIDLKNKIKTECLANNQVGQAGINDDIFILLALLATDENASSEIIQTAINTIKTDQQTDGSFTWNGWSGQDVTGAAINALKYSSTFGITIDSSIFDKAKNYLHSTQLVDGGWGFGASDSLTTAWAMYGLNSLGEGQSQWTSPQGKNPWTVLTNQLTNNGYYTSPWSADGIDWFATKHAVPALLGKSWPIILTPLAATQNIANSASSGGSGTPSTSTPTTSIITPTSTPTTTPIIVIIETSTPYQTTTTGEVLGEKITRETEVIKSVITKPKKLIAKNTLPTVQTKLAQTTQSEPEKISAVLPENIEPKNKNQDIVRIILAVSGGGALVIGVYLGLKSLKK